MKKPILNKSSLVVIILFCTIALAAFFPQTSAETSYSTENIIIQLGPVEIMRGPDTISDNPFHTLMRENELIAYIANSTTWGYIGGSLETLRPISNPVIQAGDDFDSCGAWLNSVWQDEEVVIGWYHAEDECNYPDVRKSIAISHSYDGGQSFVKPNYPYNQVLTAPLASIDPDRNDEGDHHVIQVDDYLYMYFVAERDWQVRLARSHISDKGEPNSWKKYYNGNFSEPGLGGESSPIDSTGALTKSWVSYSTTLANYIGFSYMVENEAFAGFGFTISKDGVSHWTSLKHLVLPSGGEYWGRGPDSEELVEYPSLISFYGDSSKIDDTFWLYYMYLHPGEDFDQRYLIRRKVHMTDINLHGQDSTIVRLALSKYSSNNDTRFTTFNTNVTYEFNEIVGYLFSSEVPNSVPLFDCYIDFWDDHMLVPEDDTCGGNGARKIRQIGWIPTEEFPNSLRIYRCWDPEATNHFISDDPECEGKVFEWPIGYLATMPPFKEQHFIALSNYYNDSKADYWSTTIDPPLSYEFDLRFGYLFTNPQENSHPLYDCYNESSNDHFLVVDDETCNAATNLGLMGYISTQPFDHSVPIYLCYNDVISNHFVSQDEYCDGKQTKHLIGYIAAKPTEPMIDPEPTPDPTETVTISPTITLSPEPTETVALIPTGTITPTPPTDGVYRLFLPIITR